MAEKQALCSSENSLMQVNMQNTVENSVDTAVDSVAKVRDNDFMEVDEVPGLSCKDKENNMDEENAQSSTSVVSTCVTYDVDDCSGQARQTDTSRVTMVNMPDSLTGDKTSSSTTYPVYVKSLEEAEQVLHRFENDTKTRFCVWRCPKDFGYSCVNMNSKRLYWRDFIIEDRITVKSNGIPFIMMGRKVYDCHHGRDRNIALKQKALRKREENEVKKRCVTTSPMKLDCPARVVFCEVIYFPDYKLESDTKYYRTTVSKKIRKDFSEGLVNLENIDRRIYLCFPSDDHHKGHPLGKVEGSKPSQRVEPRICTKVNELVSSGVTSEREVTQCLDDYVTKELFAGRGKPFHSNRRYYPSRSSIRVKMYNAYILKCLSMIDLENIEEATKELQYNNPNDRYFYRPYIDVDESLFNGTQAIRVGDTDEDEIKLTQKIAKEHFILVQQTEFQSHLLKRYGNTVVFLDAVYRTIRYAVPMFFLTVQTNCGYQIVASFVIQTEDRGLIKEALQVIRSWNPEWTPKIFMVDNDVEESSAIKESFTDSEVLISDFHREQHWVRWLSRPTNGVAAYKNAILVHLTSIARANSEQEFQTALSTLEQSNVWNCNFGALFKRWFEKKWLTVKERWAWYLKMDILNSVVTTNNTIKWQKEEFGHKQLIGHENVQLSHVLEILIHQLLPTKKNAYYEQNLQPSNNYPSLPTFFHNRPHQLADHVADAMTAIYDICSDDIVIDSSERGEFLVTNSDSDVEYRVCFGNAETVPHCDCQDWCTSMLPCKHFLAIMREHRQWNWSRFPESYKSSPYLTLDDNIKELLGLNVHLTNENQISTMEFNTRQVGATSNEMGATSNEMGATSNEMGATSNEVGTTSSNFEVGAMSAEAVSETNLVKSCTTNPTSNSSDTTPSISDLNSPRREGVDILAMHGDLAYEILLAKQGRKSTTSRCRDLLNEINNLTYIMNSRDSIVRLMNALEGTLKTLKLNTVDDDDVTVPDAAETRATKHDVKPHNSPAKLGKRPGSEFGSQDVRAKATKFNTAAQTNSEPVESNIYVAVTHIDLMDYCTQFNGDGINVVQHSNCASQPHDNPSKTSDTTVSGETAAPSDTPKTFSKNEENIISRRETLSNYSINLAQSLLHEMFPNLKGLQNVARGAIQAFEPISGDFIQILHDGNLHWVCTSNVSLGASKDPAAVFMYDSYNQGYIAKFTKQQLASFLCIQSAEMKVVMKSVQQHNTANDCGVFSIAFATALAFGQDPSKQRFDISKMRPHLVECLKSKKMSPFPEQTVGDEIVLSKRKFYTIELFCSCRMPYEKPKSEADLMAQCGSCKEWFHQRCEKIALEIFKASGMNFFCSACLKKVQV